MNERIKQLTKQATTIEYGVDNGFDRVTVDQEKFAELILKEVISTIYRSDISDRKQGSTLPEP